MKITTSHSMINLSQRTYVSFMSYFYHGVSMNNYFEYDTFYNFFILIFYWNLLALAIIYTNDKKRFK